MEETLAHHTQQIRGTAELSTEEIIEQATSDP
jgi:hypothetical protein